MKPLRLFLLLLCLSVLVGCSTTHFYVVRHAEKLNNTPNSPLNEAGVARAGELATTLDAANIRRIFVSDRQRTQQTAQPTAERFNVTPIVIPEAETQELIQQLRGVKGMRVLVVRHSQEIHLIVNALSPSDTITPIGNTFDNLFVIKRQVFLGRTEITLSRLKYGAPN